MLVWKKVLEKVEFTEVSPPLLDVYDRDYVKAIDSMSVSDHNWEEIARELRELGIKDFEFIESTDDLESSRMKSILESIDIQLPESVQWESDCSDNTCWYYFWHFLSSDNRSDVKCILVHEEYFIISLSDEVERLGHKLVVYFLRDDAQ